jgi:hypothetical protein
MRNLSEKYVRTNLLKNTLPGLLIVLLGLIRIPVGAQNNTLYLMHSIPQANQLNPALMHPCRIYVSLPFISSLRGNVRNTGFGFHDVFYTDPRDQPGNYSLDLDKLDNTLRRMNYSLANADVDLLGLGFPLQQWYITFLISSHTSSQFSYPHDVVLLQDAYWNLNASIPDPLNLHNLEANSTAWNSIGISASREVRKGLRVGARVKYLNGMANVTTPQSAINMNASSNPPSLRAAIDYRINSSLPLTLGYSPGGVLDDIGFEPAIQNLAGNYLFTPNHGFAIDAGITYELDEITQISASVTDLGFIRWKKNITYFSVNETFEFSQADLNQFIIDPGQDGLSNALQDSVSNAINASASTNSYFTTTPINLYGGITRQLLPDLKAGVMTWIEINSLQVRPSLTLSLNFTPFEAFAATVSYTLMNNKYNQIGTGLAFGNRGAQFYVITDNIVVRYIKDTESSVRWPYNARMLSLRVGMNLFFGCNDKKDNPGGKKRWPGVKSRDECPAYW